MVLLQLPVFALLDVPSLLIVGGGTVSLLMLSCDAAEWSSAFSACLGRVKLLDAGRQAEAHRWFRSAGRVARASGVIGTILGVIGAISEAGDIWYVGLSMAAGFLSLLYAILLSELVFHPVARAAEIRLQADAAAE